MSNYKKCIESEINSICSISPELIRDTFTSPAMDFTRNRKQSLGDVLKVGLLNAGTCINEQLRFCHGIGDDRASASAYIQQREMDSSLITRFRTGHTRMRGKLVLR